SGGTGGRYNSGGPLVAPGGQGKGGAVFVNAGAALTGCAAFTGNSATNAAGTTSDTQDVFGAARPPACEVQTDRTPPVVTATPAPGKLRFGLPLITIKGTVVVKDTSGGGVGTAPLTCFNTLGLNIKLSATDTGGSGVKNLTYTAAGAQSIPSTTVA